MRVVIDTNVWLSGLMLPRSVPGHVVRAASSAGITAVSSEPMLEELRLALNYRKLRPRIPLPDSELERYLTELRYLVEMVEIGSTRSRVPRDRGDDIILATFVASQADYLLSGDADLLSLRDEYPVLAPREFYDQHLR
jgi:putative PIN family toxin of toxin-antitoxin system